MSRPRSRPVLLPRRPLPAVLLVAVVFASVLTLGLGGCGSTKGPGARRMSFSSMQAINPGVDGEWVIAEYPNARNVSRWPDGRLKSLGYNVEDPQGKRRPLMLHFDQTGTLARKQYGGPVVRPPPPQQTDFKVFGANQPGAAAAPGTPGRPPPPSHPLGSPAGYSESGER